MYCPTCETAVAQAELENKNIPSVFYYIDFGKLTIATTRPELLSSCVAIFVNNKDPRYKNLIGEKITVPIYKNQITVLADEKVDLEKGTGAVMCSTRCV